MSNEIFIFHKFGEMSSKKSESLHQFNTCNNIEKKTKFHFSITIVGFEGIGHYQASEQRCYFEEMINFIH